MINIVFHRYYEEMDSWSVQMHNENELKNIIQRYNASVKPKTKAKHLLMECYCYYIRNRQYQSGICDFNTYVQHWTEAHRGVMPDLLLDMIEEQYGILERPLYIIRGTSSWCTKQDWRNTPIPNGGNND
jgi:hypothetical protein